MGEPKAGWTRVKLGEVVERHVERVDDVEGELRFVGVDDLDSESLRLRRWGQVGVDEVPPTFRYRFRTGMILVPTRRPRLRKCALAPFDGITGEKILVLKPRSDSELVPQFAPFLLSSRRIQGWTIEKEVGSVTPHFRWGDLAECEILLPPKEYQLRAVSVLLGAQRAVERSQELHEQATAVRHAWQKHIGEVLSKRKDILAPLRSCLTFEPESGCSAPERDGNTGHKVLSLAALADDGYVPGQLKSVDPTPQMVAARLSAGDLLISRSNTRDRVGFVGIFREEDTPVSFPDTMMRLSPNANLMRTAYLELVLQCPAFRGAIQATAAGTSASMKKINKRNLGAVKVPVVDVDEQDELIATLAALRDAEQKTRLRLEASRSFLRSFLNDTAIS